jgi:hypothetical protein
VQALLEVANDGRLSLKEARDYVDDGAPLRGIDFKTPHGRMLKQLRQELQDDLARATQAAREYRQRILTDADRFIRLLADFDNKLRDIARNQRPEQVQQGRDLHGQLKSLAADYAGLYELDQYSILKLPK